MKGSQWDMRSAGTQEACGAPQIAQLQLGLK